MFSASSEKYFRIVRVDDDGSETVIDPCLRRDPAEAFLRSYNEITSGGRAVAREIDVMSARLVGNADR